MILLGFGIFYNLSTVWILCFLSSSLFLFYSLLNHEESHAVKGISSRKHGKASSQEKYKSFVKNNIFLNFIYKNNYKSFEHEQVIILAVSLQRLYDKILKLDHSRVKSENLFLIDNIEKSNSSYFFEDIIDLEIVSKKQELLIAKEILTNKLNFKFRKE